MHLRLQGLGEVYPQLATSGTALKQFLFLREGNMTSQEYGFWLIYSHEVGVAPSLNKLDKNSDTNLAMYNDC